MRVTPWTPSKGLVERADTTKEIRQSVDQNQTIYVKMTEGILHDFERRVDHFRHLQWGYVCDQVANMKQEIGILRAELKQMRLGMG